MLSVKLLWITILLICFKADAQKKWAGPAAGNWEEAQNWQPQGVPGNMDDVILDNTYQQNNYKIAITGTTVSVYALSLEPAPDNNIEVIIPATNKSSPALIVSGSGSSFNIKAGGIFRNSSGLSGGQSMLVNGLMSIFNDGEYIHNTRSSHATEIVAHLSAAIGTEKGIFEFDVPGGSYPISMSARVYGTLVLSATASGGAQTYNASGSSQVTINGDFQINEGVQFNLDLTRDMFINADYIQKGGVFNIASQANNNSIKIKGDVSQSEAAIITESSNGQPVVELCGDRKQLVSFAGSIINSVALKMNNRQGVTLTSPLVLSYQLQLVTGAMKSSKNNLLSILDNCTVSGGSVNSFIDGPIKKIGDDDFEFPVGKQGDYAPLKISGNSGSVTDEFTGEYFLGSPEQVYGYGVGTPSVVRISKQEYWVLQRNAGLSSKKVSVSVGNYSNATALDKLVVLRWDEGHRWWSSEGNSFYSGVATGTLVSNEVNSFGAFTLGSIVDMQNPLLIDDDLIKINRSSLQARSGPEAVVTIVVTDVGGRVVKILELGLNSVVRLDSFSKGIYIFCLYDKLGRWLGVQEVLVR